MTSRNIKVADDKTYQLFASGDTMLSCDFPSQVYLNGPQWPLQELKHLIKNSDIALTNLECVIATQGKFWDKREHKPFYYRAPPVVLDVLVDAGFDVVITANNHSMDFGPDALMEQIELLELAGITSVGSGNNISAAMQPSYIKTGDATIAFLGLTTYNAPVAALENGPGVLWLDDNTEILRVMAPLIVQAHLHADLIVFSPHWGGNWTENPSEDRITLAHNLIDLGVDAIIGHSAHQLHGIEIYKGRPIVYDMGSFLWDIKKPTNRNHLTAGFILEFDNTGFTRLVIHPLQMKYAHTVPADPGLAATIHTLLIDLSRAINPNIEFQYHGNTLVLPLHSPLRQRIKKIPPDNVHTAGHIRNLPEHVRTKLTNMVYDSIPVWIDINKRIGLTHGVEFLGARVVASAHRNSGFTAEIALKVSGPIYGWQAVIKGVEKYGKDRFTWHYPIANGNWPPESWHRNEIGTDLIIVRPPMLKGGTYRLFWHLENTLTHEFTTPTKPNVGDSEGYISIGEIWMGSLGIPREAAGVSWSGDLDLLQSILKKLNMTKNRIIALTWLVFVILIFSTALAVMF